ncbi:circadian phase modifier CpmA [Saccharobesus litoralis]|uniref:Circadian phase modifier CpmA n=1 Tax=Saccharobesus litoralis TaxID=2172099 RepID=A0A2S0VPI9_9ALTE|nr:nickel pincer cofactor biosynthesis protein LarB [Saccharobesus litoralis]AWB66102.1 circadian phase modifier CpmA [Saccharobesus litoralis]
MNDAFIWDAERASRTGVAEAVFCQGKANGDLIAIIEHNLSQQRPLFMTRLSQEQWCALLEQQQSILDYDPHSQTAMANVKANSVDTKSVCIVCAGTSDLSVAKEAQRSLLFNGVTAPLIADVGVAGLWRLMDKIELIRQYKMIIAVAGMEGALFSVLAGLVTAPIVAVPSAVGYGVSAHGQAALSSALASCSPGIMTVNINNGFGAAACVVKTLRQFKQLEDQ